MVPWQVFNLHILLLFRMALGSQMQAADKKQNEDFCVYLYKLSFEGVIKLIVREEISRC